MKDIERIKELTLLLNKASDAYYNTSDTIMSDKEFDKLLDELRSLEESTGFIMATSPTQNVGYEVKSKLEKVKHNHPMLSLDKTKSVDDVVKFLGDQPGICMAKMDGLTCSLRYVNGELVSAETRGNGEIGEDILHCAKTIKNIPLKLECLDELIIDGEIIITYDDFDKINSTLPEEQKYKHPRNLASGSIRQLDSSVAAQRSMKFIAWKLVKGWMYVVNKDYHKNSFFDRLCLLEHLGFEIVTCIQFDNTDEHSISNDIIWIQETCRLEGNPIDGCVFGYDNVQYGESLGATGHHLRSQLAFKFYDELYQTKLQRIDWTLGKTGVLTPTAVFDPVEIDGSIVERASVHNVSIVENLALMTGDTIEVYKANMIIPQIKRNVSAEQRDIDGGCTIIDLPNHCPVCGGKTAINQDNESEVLICTNPNCAGKKLAQFVHFVSRKCMNIDGLSEATLEKFISLGYINDFKSIYHLSDHHKELVKLDGFGQKSVEKLLLAIEKSRNVKLENFIAALGIDGIGLSASKTISEHFNGDIDAVLDTYDQGFDWTELSDFGDVMAKNLNDFFEVNIANVYNLAGEMHFIMPEQKKVNDNPFVGKNLCVTGKLNHFSRDSINEKIASLGAKAVGSVSKKTDYLITNEQSGSSKYKKAIELNIPIITEDEFLTMLGE